MVVSEGVCPGVCTPFGTRQELTSRARQNLTTNRPRRLCLSGDHGLVALGLAARAKRRCLNLLNKYAPAARMMTVPPVGIPRGMISL